MATNPEVIPALMDTLAEAREAARKEYRHVRNFTATSERMLRRYEDKENFPPGADIDRLVAAYARALGEPASVFDLWDAAISRAKRAAAASDDPPDETGAERESAEEASGAAPKPRRGRGRGSVSGR